VKILTLIAEELRRLSWSVWVIGNINKLKMFGDFGWMSVFISRRIG
jgi:hypothetical protein